MGDGTGTELRDLEVSVAGQPLLHHVGLRVQPGRRVALLGASGSGKSLTVLALLGLLGPQFRVQGTLRVDGRELPWRQAPGRRPGMAAVFQDSQAALNPVVRLDRQLLPAVARRRRTGAAEAGRIVAELLREVGFEDPERILRAHPSQLSGGQRQRVCLALALASAPDLLVADEPTTALDMISQRQVVEALRRCTGPGRSALLFITHDLAVAADLCDDVVVLERGRVVEADPMPQVLRSPRAAFTVALVAAARAGLRPAAAPQEPDARTGLEPVAVPLGAVS
ncbi:ATP-binding cassette domain-containing protein [Kocuria sediminis]|uniref:ATP-binding cassette domain-containing protein n=1 Tax=Kocuria sediminis TaxID=1038857 RepID=A0A6N8GJ22_9MICC|nr:ATP-binding cassette domain-containing protein [Kocuria sediminis]MUN63091.1 ATP-binding cassette domain-containing protein [Kocuria sediminis]